MAEWEFDVFIIGGGPGGYAAALEAARLGLRTALAEKDRLGGACLHRGCIPAKTLLRAAEALLEVKGCAAFGVAGAETSGARLDMRRVQERKRAVIAQLAGGMEAALKRARVSVFAGEAALLDAHTVRVCGGERTCGNVIIASGSEPKRLPAARSADARVLTSGGFLDLETVPKSAVIIGGGVIGVEFAWFLAAAGAEVTLVEFLPGILPMMDGDISARIARMLAGRGVAVCTGARVTEITASGVSFERGGAAHTAEGEIVLEAVGRAPSFGGIRPEALGIVTERGAIVTDAAARTSVPNIFAVGDVNGKSMLAHTAAAEGVAAARAIAGLPAAVDYGRIPAGIYTQPEAASAGLTEQEARERFGAAVRAGKAPVAANGKALAEGAAEGLVKVITAEGGVIAGVHIFAPHATEMIAEAVIAMNAGFSAGEAADAVRPHPSISESIAEACRAAR